MKIVVLEKMSLGFDVDISFYEEFGEVTYYDTTRPEEIAGRVADADVYKRQLAHRLRHKNKS